MPHPREACSKYPFIVAAFAAQSSTVKNKLFCPYCYCYVCEVKASECIDWSSHCDATRKLSAWRSRKATLTSPLMLMLPPTKRPQMYQLGQRILGLNPTELNCHIDRAKELLTSLKTETNLENQKSSYVEAVFILWSSLKRSITDHAIGVKKNGNACLLYLGIALLMTKSFTVPYASKQICTALNEEASIVNRSMVSIGSFSSFAVDMISTLLLLATPERKVNPDWIFQPLDNSAVPSGLKLADSDASSLVFKILQEVGASQLTLMEFAFIYNQELFSQCVVDLLKSLNVEYLSRFISHILNPNSKFSFAILMEVQYQSLTFQHFFLLFSLLQRSRGALRKRKFLLLQSLSRVAIHFLETTCTANKETIRKLFQDRIPGTTIISQSKIDDASSVIAMDPSDLVNQFNEYSISTMKVDILYAFEYSWLNDWISSFTLPSENAEILAFMKTIFDIKNHTYFAPYFLHFGLQYFASTSAKDKFRYLLSGVALSFIYGFFPKPSFLGTQFLQTIPEVFFNGWSSRPNCHIPPIETSWTPDIDIFSGLCRPETRHIKPLLNIIQTINETNFTVGSFISIIWDMTFNIFLDFSFSLERSLMSPQSFQECITLLKHPLLMPLTEANIPEILLLPNILEEISLSQLSQFKSVAKSQKNINMIPLWSLWQRVIPRMYILSTAHQMIMEDYPSIRNQGRQFLYSLREAKPIDFDLENHQANTDFIWSIVLEQCETNLSATLRIVDDLAQKSPELLRHLLYSCPLSFVNIIITSRLPSLVFLFRDVQKDISSPSHSHHCFHSHLSTLWAEIESKISQSIDADISKPQDQFVSSSTYTKVMEDSFLAVCALRQNYIIKRLVPLLFDQPSPNKKLLLRALNLATSIEDVLFILQYTLEYVRKWGDFSSFRNLPLYKDMQVSSEPLIVEAFAILEPSYQSVSSYIERLTPTDPQQIADLASCWKKSLAEKDYFHICLKYLPSQFLEQFLEERSKSSESFNEINPLVREAIEAIVSSFREGSVQKSYLLLQWTVAFFLSFRWEDDFSFTSVFTQFLLTTSGNIVECGLPLPEPSPSAIEIPTTKFGLTLFPSASFKIFKFLIHPLPECYYEILKFSLSQEIKLKLLGATQQNLNTFVRLCAENRQYEYLFQQLTKKYITNIREYLAALELRGLLTPTHFSCSRADMELVQEYGLNSEQLTTLATLANRNCLLPLLKWVRHIYGQNLIDSESCSSFLSKIRVALENNPLGCLLCALYQSMMSIVPIVQQIHIHLAEDQIVSSLNKLSISANDCFQMVLDGCSPEQTESRGHVRIMRYIRYMEFRCTYVCSIPSCSCSCLFEPTIADEILRKSFFEMIRAMLENPASPGSTTGLDDVFVADIMTKQLKPIHDFLTAYSQADVKAIVPQLISCTRQTKFQYLIRYSNESKFFDFFYPIFKIVFEREGRSFDHLEFLFTLSKQNEVNYSTFRTAWNSASTQGILSTWVDWFRDLYRYCLYTNNSSTTNPNYAKFLNFFMSFPRQDQLESSLQDLWKELFPHLYSGARYRFWPGILQYRSRSQTQIDIFPWLSHVEVILTSLPNIVWASELSNFLAVCHILIVEFSKFGVMTTFLQNYCRQLISDRVDPHKRTFFQQMMMGLKTKYLQAKAGEEWRGLCYGCIKILNPKKKVQEVVKELL